MVIGKMKEIIDCINKIVLNSNNYIKLFEYDNYSHGHMAYLLFQSIIEILSDQAILLKEKRYKSFFRLMRTNIELYADLFNLSENNDYALNIKYTMLLEQKRIFMNIRSYKNISQALSKISNHPKYTDENDKLESRIKTLKMEGAKKITSKNRFIENHQDDELLTNLYTISFHELSQYVHGNLYSLIEINEQKSIKSTLKGCMITIPFIIQNGLSSLMKIYNKPIDDLSLKIDFYCEKLSRLSKN